MEFDIDFNDREKISCVECFVEIDFIEGFLYDVKELASALDEEEDDMIAYSLVEKEAKIYLIRPNGDCTANIYHIKDADLIQLIQETIENFEE